MTERAVALGAGASGIVTLALILAFQDQFPVARAQARLVGFVVLGLGVALMVWAGFHLKAAVGGLVSPRTPRLVMTGPYRYLRHPYYLGTFIAMLGAAIVARSSYGLLATVLLFLPAEALRARLEDRALATKFGSAWKHYSSRVGAFVPRTLGENVGRSHHH